MNKQMKTWNIFSALFLAHVFVGLHLHSAQGAPHINDSFYESKDAIICYTMPKKTVCDISHLNSMGAQTRRISLPGCPRDYKESDCQAKAKDAADFLEIVKRFRKPEEIRSEVGRVLNYKFMSDQLATLFMCIVRYPNGPGIDSKCTLYYNPFKKDPYVKILEDANFVNIIFKKPEVVATIKQVFREKGVTHYQSSEKVSVRLSPNQPAKLFSKVSLTCGNTTCEVRAVPESVNFTPDIFGNDDRPFFF